MYPRAAVIRVILKTNKQTKKAREDTDFLDFFKGSAGRWSANVATQKLAHVSSSCGYSSYTKSKKRKVREGTDCLDVSQGSAGRWSANVATQKIAHASSSCNYSSYIKKKKKKEGKTPIFKVPGLGGRGGQVSTQKPSVPELDYSSF
uniref:Putative secretory protein n=1 Tax=Argas monolakensis TaxID=34602 RepID=Q09JI1_ARGMO|nr:putative secretory protein [Argas monolakensis]